MYHVGKVVMIFDETDKGSASADNSVQVLLEMWDENYVTVVVHPTIQGNIKEGSIVLVRYAQPEEIILRVLSAKSGKAMWDKMKDYISGRKKAAAEQNKPQQFNPYIDMPPLNKMIR